MQSSSAGRRALPLIPALVLALLMPLTLPPAAFAQDDEQTIGTPTGSAVARIDALSGDVAIQRGDSNDTLAAVANAPVLGADYVTTGDNGRAEVGFDGRAAVRLGENVQIRFSKLDTGDRQMQLAAGTIELRLFGDTDGQSAIDTPSISIVPRSAGSFRVSVDNNGDTAVTVRGGSADIITPQGTQQLQPGTTLIASGPASNPQIQTQRAIARDAFDSYNGERDHVYELATASSPYVNTEIQGVGDLNSNGRWVEDGSYGHVWIPSQVASDWAPYRDGNWTWEDGYGWTWIARESWGWAPYHYGRWYYSAGYHHWAWYPPAPGRFAPAWSPALVGFVGFNIGAVSVGIGFGNIGWVPLAPYEAFHPWWGSRGTTIVQNTTIINNYNNNYNNVHYHNMQFNGAMTSVSRENFQNGRFGERRIVSQEDIRSYRPVAVQGALPIVPGQANLRFTQRNVPVALASRPVLDQQRSFAGRGSAVQRTPFAEQQQSVSRVTHVAYRPELQNAAPGFSSERQAPAAQRGEAAPSFSRGTTNEGPWSRFNSNRNYDNRGAQSVPQNGGFNRQSTPEDGRRSTPSYQRPAFSNDVRSTQSEARPTSPTYARPAAPANTDRPAFNRFSQPQQLQQQQTQPQPQYNRETRTTPATRQAEPQYNRQSAPQYQPPQYNRQAAPQPQPQAARQAAPAYQRPERSAPAPAAAPAAAPQAHESHGDENRGKSDGDGRRNR